MPQRTIRLRSSKGRCSWERRRGEHDDIFGASQIRLTLAVLLQMFPLQHVTGRQSRRIVPDPPSRSAHAHTAHIEAVEPGRLTGSAPRHEHTTDGSSASNTSAGWDRKGSAGRQKTLRRSAMKALRCAWGSCPVHPRIGEVYCNWDDMTRCGRRLLRRIPDKTHPRCPASDIPRRAVRARGRLPHRSDPNPPSRPAHAHTTCIEAAELDRRIRIAPSHERTADGSSVNDAAAR